MGVIGNSHGGGGAPERELAEDIAAIRLKSLGEIVVGLSKFDDAGHYFWGGKTDDAVRTTTDAFVLLRSAREQLVALQDRDVELHARIRTNAKATTAAAIGITTHGEEDLTQLVAGDRRIAAMLDHLLLQEEAAVAGISSNDFQPYYRALSSPGRHLLEDVIGHLATVVRVSRFTHEWSDAVMSVINRERELDPHAEFVGPVQV